MAETTNRSDHMRSIDIKPNSLPMLNGGRYGNRYGFETNQPYIYPTDDYKVLKPTSEGQPSAAFIKMVQWFVNDHYTYQLKRILELERYYNADNNIHYWMSGKKNRADNRIASGLARYMTNLDVGYAVYNPLTYGYENKGDSDDTGEDFLDKVNQFNQRVNEHYHNMMIWKMGDITGRAYELLYLPQGSNLPNLADIDPNSAFVVWNSDINSDELFAVRYFSVSVMDQVRYLIDVYTDQFVYHFQTTEDPQSNWDFKGGEPHQFDGVPLLEIKRNNERIGKFEPKLDEIDAYDQSLSEMANSQTDFSNAMLMISGVISKKGGKYQQARNIMGQLLYLDPYGKRTLDQKDKDGKPNTPLMVEKVLDTKTNAIFLKPYTYDGPNGTKLFNQTTAQYLTKQLNATDWKTYIDQLLQDIHKETNTPDTSDQNFVGNASGVAMNFKLWGDDQETAVFATLFSNAITQRLKLLAGYWNKLPNSGVTYDNSDPSNNPANFVTITFSPHLPKDNAEQMQIVQGLASVPGISMETVRTQAATITGVSPDTEKDQYDQEQTDKTDQTGDVVANAIQKLHLGNGDDQNSGDDDNGDENDDETNQTTNQKAGQSGRPKQPQN